MSQEQPIRFFLTARDSADRLAERAPLMPGDGEPDLPAVWVEPGRSFQTMLGFGGAFTEAAAVNWLKLGLSLIHI